MNLTDGIFEVNHKTHPFWVKEVQLGFAIGALRLATMAALKLDQYIIPIHGFCIEILIMC